MRQEAFKIMKLLDAYDPLLIGSVWRGTARLGSDIDIAAYADTPEQVLEFLKNSCIKIQQTYWTKVNKQGVTFLSYHVHAETRTKISIDLVVRNPEEAVRKRKCDIFGDEIKGLRTLKLEKLLKENPTRQFLP
ncbi:MAG: nucleotidyltransferase domain-containing protein [Nitrososphaerota archaeon]|nr:nucleotidyltransferase domain-containing protein [Nitrososphaerota archaeon]